MDPCERFMEAYEQCVKSYRHGLRSDEDCRSEAEAYKACRKRVKESRAKSGAK